MLADKNIVLGVTGGISVYKMCTVVRLLKKAGAHVRVVMTQSATEFVTPLTFSTLSEEEVIVSLWPKDKHSSTDLGVKHIDLGLWAHAMLVAPATANTIAHLAHGYAEDIISSTVLALRCPLIVAPAMDVDMWENDATQQNVSILKGRGIFIIPPESGELASGLVGAGRLPEPDTIVDYVDDVLEKTPCDLSGKKILVTAGPTHEPIDPVRFIGNRSSGKMGFALATAASLRGADVTLISGPVSLGTPKNVKRIDVETAEQMHNAVLDHFEKTDILIMAAAVADYTPVEVAEHKIKKLGSHAHGISVELRSTSDILHIVAEKKSKQIVVGFALETTNELEHAKQKLEKKNLDMIVLNSTNDKGAAFGTETNVVTIIQKDGTATKLPKKPKFDVAMEILNYLLKLK
ncbi:MAG: bifunctional phosphopantothenoylcysteine decarboxylase/phosphopantothenate--cysteine ligase CoaBC [Ignavibacteriales bacterium]|nr:bifunctional phosphopantothenoylcysteine decarboxylase/phosphopantothenate--cysteine ligase CoaBC [Ignavibacteriales bacterium]